MTSLLTAFLVWSVCALSAEGQMSPDAFHDRVVATYDFLPRTLDDAGLEAKSRQLDAFWLLVKANADDGVNALRSELRRTDQPAFFYYDGAKLLLSLSKAAADRRLALAAVGRADLRDIQRDDYFYTVHDFAVDELDTSDAAFKILDDPTFKVLVPQHALTLEHDYCLLYLLLPTREEYYLDKAIARLFDEKDPTAFKSLLHLIAATVTSKGDAAIARYAEDDSRPAELRDIATMVRTSLQAMKDVPLLGVSPRSYASLKEQQRKLMARVSDEALYDLRRLELRLRRKGVR